MDKSRTVCNRHVMLRIGNSSGFYGDRLSAMREMLDGGRLDVLTGDYLAELTMAILDRDHARDPAAGYARTYLRQLRDCLRLVLDRRVVLVSNAGGVNPAALVAAIRELAAGQGLHPRVALVRGDRLGPGEHAYLGAFGIARAVAGGADVVVTGRVTDASLVIGPAIARFGWSRTDLDALAGATVAGHVLECGAQATGGNYAFAAEIPDPRLPGFPIAEIEAGGSAVITKHPGSGGAVTVGTVTAQLVYEVGDARYAGPDVTTRLDTVELTAVAEDRVQISGVRGEPPPPTLKVARTAGAGFRNEVTVVLTGPDVTAKAGLFRRQFEGALPARPATLTWTLQEPAAVPQTQWQASALLTVSARDPDERVVGRSFSGAAVELALSSFAGFFVTAPPGPARPAVSFGSAAVAQDVPAHEVVHDDGTVEPIAPPRVTRPLVALTGPAASEPRAEPGRRLPLGTVCGARSGDKGGTANVGLWVRTDEAYRWMAGLLTTERIRTLLPEAAACPITVTRLPNLRAVNVVIDGLLGDGVAGSDRFDPQAKALGEWLRSRPVDIPERLL